MLRLHCLPPFHTSKIIYFSFELTSTSAFALIFKRSKPCRFQLTSISWHSPYCILTHRSEILKYTLTILLNIICQNSILTIISTSCRFMKSSSVISDSISELSNILSNNFYSPKQKLHFPLLNLHSNFYLSTKYKLCFILVYRNCFSCQRIKTTFPIFLLGFALAHLSKLTHYINRSTS